MSNTNDPQAPYGEKRDPMLSDLQALEVACPHVEYGGYCSFYGTDALFSIRDFYEAKITSGELRVVKTCHHIRVELGAGVSTLCSSCKEDRYWDVHMKYCPGCGAEIAK